MCTQTTIEPQGHKETAASLADSALAVLGAAEPANKVRLTRAAVGAWRRGALVIGPSATTVPARPARLDRPLLVPPHKVPKRKINRGPAGRVALLHAIAHIELNAIDLAWDLIARFAAGLPHAFADDWVGVAAEEAEHFALIVGRLGELGAAYGDLPAHDGLWQSALATRHDLAARLAVAPLVLEARGLDVTPGMIAKLRAAGDGASAEILEVIYRQEIGHVATGRRWFEHVCAERGWPPQESWRDLVRRHFKGSLKPPFNEDARRRAGFGPDYYAPPGP